MALSATGPAPVLDPATVHRTVLPNGLTVLVRHDATAPVAAVVTYVKAGYFDEPDRVAGIAHVLEHMYFKGTPTYGVGEIARETKARGGYLNAHTIYDHTSYYAVVPSAGFAEALAVQADAYARSLIDAEELRREIEVIVQEAKRKRDNPAAVAREGLYALLHDVHRMRRWRIGTEEGLRGFTRDDLVGFYRNHYRPSNTIVSIVGDVEPDEALALVQRLYGGLPAGEPERDVGPGEPEHRDFRWADETGDVTQSQLVMGWRVPGLLDPDAPLLDAAAAVLSAGRASRLYRGVRERGLAASIHASNYTPGEVGVFTIHAETRPGRELDAARAALAAVADLGTRGPDELELERARRLVEAGWLRRLETMEGQASHLAEWEAAGDWRLGERYLERLVAATADQVREVVSRRLPREAVGVVTYRPAGSAPLAADADAVRRALVEAAPEAPAATPPRAAVPSAPAVPRLRAERVEADVHVYRTASGLPVLVRRRPGSPLLHAGLLTLGGACDETRNDAGITKLLARTALKGTAHRDAVRLAEETELLGASLGASVGAESFGWSISAPVRHAAAALDLLADVAQHPALSPDALEVERTVALADLVSLRDDMYRFPVRLALAAAYGDHPYGIPATGDERSLQAASVERLRAWHERRLLGGAPVLGIVGDLEPDEAAALAAARFEALGARETSSVGAPGWPAGPVQASEAREKAQTALALALPGPARRDPARFAAELLTDVASGLGGRFFEELRDKRSLAYTVNLASVTRREAGLFLAYIGTAPEREDEARDGLRREFARFAEAPVTDEELQRACTYAIGTHAIARQSGGAVLGELLDAWLLGDGLHELDDYADRVRAVTTADIQAVASRALEGAWVEGVVRGRG